MIKEIYEINENIEKIENSKKYNLNHVKNLLIDSNKKINFKKLSDKDSFSIFLCDQYDEKIYLTLDDRGLKLEKYDQISDMYVNIDIKDLDDINVATIKENFKKNLSKINDQINLKINKLNVYLK